MKARVKIGASRGSLSASSSSPLAFFVFCSDGRRECGAAPLICTSRKPAFALSSPRSSSWLARCSSSGPDERNDTRLLTECCAERGALNTFGGFRDCAGLYPHREKRAEEQNRRTPELGRRKSL